MTKKISVVIPVHNEEKNIEELCARLKDALCKTGCPYEVIFVDDGSTDESLALLTRIKKEDAHIIVIYLGRWRGQAAAYRAAFARVTGETIITLDADLQQDPAEVGLFIDKLGEGFDFVGGNRTLRRTPISRRAFSFAANRIARAVTGIKLHDYGCGFNAFTKELLLLIDSSSDSSHLLKCALVSRAKKIGEISVTHHPRKHAYSKYGFSSIIKTGLTFIMQLNGPALFLILVLAAIVRFWGINFGLPNPFCRPDEGIIVSRAVNFCRGDLNPHFFQYPTLYMYLVAVLYFAYFIIKAVLGAYGSFNDFLTEYIIYPSNLYLLDRMLSAFLGILTVFVLYRITLPLCGRRAARISSFFLAIAYLHVRESHFGVTDVTMTLFIMCSILFIMRNLERPELKNYALAGTFAGLAASTKYAGALLIVPAILTAVLCKPGWRKIIWHSSVFALFAVVLFFAASPFALVYPGEFSSQFLFQVNRVLNGDPLVLQRGWIYHMRFTLFFGLGWSLLVASLMGIAVFVKKNPRECAIFFSFPLAYYVLIGSGLSVFVRYALPLVPFLCLSAAIFAGHIIDKIYARARRPYNTFFALLILAVIAGPSLNNVIKFDYILSKKDTRLLAAEWIFENVPENSTILQSSLTGEVFLPLFKKRLLVMLASGNEGPAAVKRMTDYAGKRGARAYDQILQNEFAAKGGGSTPPDYMILVDHPLKIYGAPSKKIIEITQRSYSLKKSFIAIKPESRDNVFDELDAFYVPFAGFKEIERPGPNIFIYERKDRGGSP